MLVLCQCAGQVSIRGGQSAECHARTAEVPNKDQTLHVWSVIDGVVQSDFPDMQIKCTIRTPRGSCMVTPQGNNRARIYVQIPSEEGKNMSASASQTRIQRMANEILSPYRVEWETVDWHSVYYIGQGIPQTYSVDNRIFIGGDACHTHSPKAGQGMNYEERRAVASRLIEFDVTYTGLFSTRNPQQQSNDEIVRIFKENSLLTSGYGVEYPPNTPTQIGHRAHDTLLPTLSGLQPGRNFPSLSVTRVIDACEIPLEREVPFNGSFHVYVFAGEPQQQNRLADLSGYLARQGSVSSQVRGNQEAVDMSYDGRHKPHSALYTFSRVLNAVGASIGTRQLPLFFRVYRYHVYSDDARSRKARAGRQGAAHSELGFDAREGRVVVVRPDGSSLVFACPAVMAHA
ncbi:phenol hydroxylase [Aspergillus aurantiobrunneus]